MFHLFFQSCIVHYNYFFDRNLSLAYEIEYVTYNIHTFHGFILIHIRQKEKIPYKFAGMNQALCLSAWV